MNSVGSFAAPGGARLDQHLLAAIRTGDDNALREVLAVSGVRYLLYSAGVPKGADQWLEQPVFPRDQATMTALARELGASEVAHFGSGRTATAVFTLPRSTVLPMLYVEGNEQVKRDVPQPSGQDVRSVQPATGGITGLHPDAAPVQSVERVSPWQYRIRLNLAEPSTLFFLERYDSGWVATMRSAGASDMIALKKVPANGYASAWNLPRMGEVIVHLSYGPQKVTWVAMAVTGMFIVLLTLLAAADAITTFRRRRPCSPLHLEG